MRVFRYQKIGPTTAACGSSGSAPDLRTRRAYLHLAYSNPSENYYYFSFVHQGEEYAGNLRLDIADRDKGLVQFAYSKKYTEWRRGADPTYGLLGKADGVTESKAESLAYDIAFNGKVVRFDLVDLSKTKPPKKAVADNESYLRPVLDEPGIQFYLLFNRHLKVFHYILNEAVSVGERLMQSEVSKHIKFGSRIKSFRSNSLTSRSSLKS